MFYAFIDSKNKLSGFSSGSMTITDEYGSSDVQNIEVSEQVYNNAQQFGSNYYIYSNGEIILNPNYEQEQLIKQKQARIEEIKEELNELDLKSIRSIRANETDRISQYEQEAQTLRDELNELISEIKELGE